MKIYQKIFAIQNELTSGIRKGKLNKFQNYWYFTEEQILQKLKPLLANHQLVMTFSDVESENSFTYEKSEKEYLVKYLKKAILTSSEKPEEQLVYYFWAVGSNTDPARAKGSAETYAVKYFLSKFFLIPISDTLDPDQWSGQVETEKKE